MSELVDWFRAQLDDEETAAKAAGGDEWTFYDAWGTSVDGAAGTVVYDEGAPTEEQARHIARWDPARVLAEVAAKRRIIERLHHEPYEGLRNSWEYGEVVTEEYVSCSCGWEKVITHGHDWDDLYAAHCDELGVNPTIAEAVLRLLALPYAGRDGWREEWRPDASG